LAIQSPFLFFEKNFSHALLCQYSPKNCILSQEKMRHLSDFFFREETKIH